MMFLSRCFKGTVQAVLYKQYFLYAMERLMIVNKNLYELVQLYFYQKVFCMIILIIVRVPKFRMRKVTRPPLSKPQEPVLFTPLF